MLNLKLKTLIMALTLIIPIHFVQAIQPITLKQALERVPELDTIKEVQFEKDKTQNDESFLRANFRPRFDVLTGVGPINKAKGDAIDSQNSDVTNVEEWKAMYVFKATGNVILHTWGQKQDYLQAIRNNQIISDQKVVSKINEVRFKLKEVYYAHLMANNFIDLLEGAIGDIQKAQDHVGKNKDQVYQLSIFENLLVAKNEEAKQQQQISLKALLYYMGKDQKNDVLELEEKWLFSDTKELQSLEYYQNLLLQNKPELLMLEKAIDAKNSLASAKDKDMIPKLGLFIKYEYSKTSARQPQTSVFAYDPYNENSLVVGLGFKWDLNFGISKSEAQKERIESMQLEAKKRDALQGLQLLVEKHWQEIQALEKSVDHLQKATKSAKKWLSSKLLKGSLGTINADQVAKAYEARLKTAQELYEKIYHYNMAWAQLSLTLGQEVDPALLP